MPVSKISGLFKSINKSLTSSKAKPARPGPEKTGAASQLNDTVKDGLTDPRQSVVKPIGGSALERRFAKDTLWDSDRQSMMTAIGAQIAKHGGQERLSVPVNGKAAELSCSMVIDQLQLFVSLSKATGQAPASLSPMMHASLQIWHDVTVETNTGRRQHPFMSDLSKKVDEALRKAGNYVYLAKVEGTTAKMATPVAPDNEPLPAPIIVGGTTAKMATPVAPGSEPLPAPIKVGGTTAKMATPVTPDGEPLPAPMGRPLRRRFVRGSTGAADTSPPASLISKSEKIAAAPVLAETTAMPFLEPLPYHPGLLNIGPVIDGAQAPTEDELLSLLVSDKGSDKAIAAVPVEGGRLLLMAVSRQPQFADGIALAARTINLNPNLAGKCSRECVLVKDLPKLLGEHMYLGE